MLYKVNEMQICLSLCPTVLVRQCLSFGTCACHSQWVRESYTALNLFFFGVFFMVHIFLYFTLHKYSFLSQKLQMCYTFWGRIVVRHVCCLWSNNFCPKSVGWMTTNAKDISVPDISYNVHYSPVERAIQTQNAITSPSVVTYTQAQVLVHVYRCAPQV